MTNEARTIALLHEYGSAKFGDEWWPGNAEAWIGPEKGRELAVLLDAGARAQFEENENETP